MKKHAISHDAMGIRVNDPRYVAGDSSNGSLAILHTSSADRDYIAADRDSSSKFFSNGILRGWILHIRTQ